MSMLVSAALSVPIVCRITPGQVDAHLARKGFKRVGGELPGQTWWESDAGQVFAGSIDALLKWRAGDLRSTGEMLQEIAAEEA